MFGDESEDNSINLQQVQAALEKIRPYVRRDGGDIELIAVEGNNVRLRLVGHCVGCPSSMMTLRYGIEQLLREEIPGFGEVIPEMPGGNQAGWL